MSKRRDARAARRVAIGMGSAGLVVVVLIIRAVPSGDRAPDALPALAPAAASAAEPAAAQPEPAPAAAPQPKPTAGPRPFAGQPIAGGQALFDRELLIEAGLAAQDADRLRERYEASVLEQSRLRERARRNGRPQEVDAQLERADQKLRTDLGEQMYDYLRYGAGQFNRVQVDAVDQGSSAAAAGVKAGDLIRRYAGQPVFEPSELVLLTSRVALGRRLPLQVERDRQLIDLQIDSGPLGTALSPVRSAP